MRSRPAEREALFDEKPLFGAASEVEFGQPGSCRCGEGRKMGEAWPTYAGRRSGSRMGCAGLVSRRRIIGCSMRRRLRLVGRSRSGRDGFRSRRRCGSRRGCRRSCRRVGGTRGVRHTNPVARGRLRRRMTGGDQDQTSSPGRQKSFWFALFSKHHFSLRCSADGDSGKVWQSRPQQDGLTAGRSFDRIEADSLSQTGLSNIGRRDAVHHVRLKTLW